jgi:hypothetical protein
MKTKKLIQSLTGIAAITLASSLTVQAQNAPGRPVDPVPPEVERPLGPVPPETTPVSPERPVVVNLPDRSSPELPERPDAPEIPGAGSLGTPLAVLDMIAAFKEAREAFLAVQSEIVGELKEATEEQREAIRARIRENVDQFRQAKLDAVQELRNRVDEVRNELQPDLEDVINQARENGRD